MDKDDFYLEVAHALSSCQLVEQQLKLYITEALQLAKKCIGEDMPFKMAGDDYTDSSLERLIDAFKKLSDNETLLKDLGQFKKERNFLSHKGITHCLDYVGDLQDSTADEYRERLKSIQKKAQELRLAIQKEANKFRALLFFDDLTEG